MTFKQTILGATSLAAAFAITPMTARAQEIDIVGNAQEETAVQRLMNTITVTATKQKDPEDVQGVAIAVTAFNEDTLDVLNVKDLQDLSYSVPNVSLTDNGTSKGYANFAMRGLGLNSSIGSIDPSVGTIIDGVPLGINGGLVFDTFDIGSVEILRGPQGILQGRNTVGGVVALNTGNPTSELAYDFKISSETPVDDGRGGLNSFAQGVVSGPLIDGKLNGKIAAYYNYDEGYFKNQFNNDNHGEGDVKIIRGALEYFPTENFTILAKAEYADFTGDGPATQNRSLHHRGSFDISIDETGFYDNSVAFGMLRMDWDVGFGDGTITNISGYRKYKAASNGDIDGLPSALFNGPGHSDTNQFSNELRYNGSFGDLTLTSGFFYFDQTIKSHESRELASFLVNPALPAGLLKFPGGGVMDHSSLGAFAQLEYQFTERFSGQVGLRYSYEEKEAGLTYIIPALLRGISDCSVVEGTCPVDFTDKNDWSGFTPKIAVEYEVSDAALLYASYNRGFRSGGYNFRITDPTTFAILNNSINNNNRFFDEETIDAFEVGYKYQSENGRVVLNSALFFNKAKDLQRELIVASNAGTSQLIYNTADADIKGVELEGRFSVTDNLIITGNLGYIDAKYTDIRFPISAGTIAAFEAGQVSDSDYDLKLPRTPEMTYGIGFVWEQDLNNAGSLLLAGNFQHRDEAAHTDNNIGILDAVDMVTANLTWNTPKDGISVSLFGRNLLDEATSGNDAPLPFNAGVTGQSGTFSPLIKGRTVGLELSIKG